MNKVRKILLIVEGAKSEVVLFNKAFQEYKLNLNYEIYSYCTNIYDLYERMFDKNEDDLDSLDLLGILKERGPGNINLDEDFSDILLVFDYDPHDNRFSVDRINLMLHYFNESTENGKLYINYPMVESFKHLKSNPDEDYKDRMVNFSIVSSGGYKKLVNDETKYPDINRYNKKHFDSIIIHNIKKANYISKREYEIIDIKSSYYNIMPDKILQEQNIALQKLNKIYVLNTCLFFICDYQIDLILK